MSSRINIRLLLAFVATLCLVVGKSYYAVADFVDIFNEEKEMNFRPIIGVLTQELDFGPEVVVKNQGLNLKERILGDDERKPTEYIAASYVKFVESAGARVVAVRYNQSKETLYSLFDKLNGVLIPGGGTELKEGHPFYTAGNAVWEYSKGHPDFPIFGTCLGMELLTCVAAKDPQIIHPTPDFNASNVTYNLKLTLHARYSRLLSAAYRRPHLLHAMQTQNITYNQHELGVSPETFAANTALSEHFNILATSFDSNGKEFVAIMEHKKHNVFGVQFHPEKSVFEWLKYANFPHTREAVEFSQLLASVFVQATRHNLNSFKLSPDDEVKVLIQNHEKKFLGNTYFQEVYVFYADEPQLGIDIQPKSFRGVNQESYMNLITD